MAAVRKTGEPSIARRKSEHVQRCRDATRIAAAIVVLMKATIAPPLREFLRDRGIRNIRIYTLIQKSRSQFDRILSGASEPRRIDMVNILWAVQEVLEDHAISMARLFDLDPASPENQRRIAAMTKVRRDPLVHERGLGE